MQSAQMPAMPGFSSDSNSSDAADAYSACSSAGSTSKSSSLLDTLRAAKASDLERKRKMACNSAPRGGKRRKVRSSSSEPKNISPVQRVKQYPGEQLEISAGKLFLTGGDHLSKLIRGGWAFRSRVF